MLKSVLAREDNDTLKQFHLRSRLKRLNDELNITEESIMQQMRNSCTEELFLHTLINERVRIIEKCKEVHAKLYCQ
jgi:hypothetical protein